LDHTTQILLALFIVYVAALVGAEIAQRLGVPAVVGEIAAGVLVGPGLLGWVHVSEPLEVLAEIGAVLLLFAVGLETRLGDLKKVGKSATMVGILGVILPFVLGYFWAHASGQSTPHALFIAAAFVATSAGITARVLQDLGVLGRIESRVILGAAVIDDILAMLLLGLVTALQGGGSVNIGALLLVFLQAIGFIVLIVVVGTQVMRRASHILDAPMSVMSPISLSLALCLGLAVAAAYVGLAAIIGAFLAGMIAAESRQRDVLEKNLKPIEALLVPFFFVVTGAKVEIAALASWSAMGTLAVVVALATIGKIVGCGLGALSLGRKSALIVGVGMVPRGEVGIIVASLGKQAGLFENDIYALIIAMSLITSVIAPPVLKALLKATPEPALSPAP
jgi:Kef-type K+ transport system membrane component KefB